jgi:hypothetical protein
MKIYFIASMFQKDEFGKNYQTIVDTLEKLGHTVIHEHITKLNLKDVKARTPEEVRAFYHQVNKWMNEVDVVVVEASYPSTLNVGHEVTLALEKGRPTIVFYSKGRDTLFLKGLQSDKLIQVEYEEDELAETVKTAIDYAKDQADTRFNFFISPKHVAYLDWIAKNKRLPRSVYLRRLIEKDMANNDSY